jgi:hypothetical protein
MVYSAWARPRGHGFLGLHANVHSETRRVVQGIVSDLLARIDRLDGQQRCI